MTAELILSKSSIESFLTCGYQWLLGYVYRVKGAPSLDMAVGTAVHAGAEAHWKGEDPIFAARRALAREMALGPTPDEDEAAGAIRDSLAMTRLYIEKVAPTFTPTIVEKDFLIRVDGQLVSGRIDAADDDVHDTKTTSTPSKVTAERNSLGMSIYRHGFRALTGRLPGKLILDVVARNGRWKALEVPPDDQGMAEVIGLTSRAIMAGNFAPTGAQNGSCARCPYYERQCTYGRIGSPQAPDPAEAP